MDEGIEGVTIDVENPDDLDPNTVWDALESARGEFASLEDWVINTVGGMGFSTNNYGGLDAWGAIGYGSPYNTDLQQRSDFFNRNEYRAPRSIMDEFRLANDLVLRDDVVSGIGDLTEGLAIQKMKWECESIEEEDVWNQIARDLDLDARLREMWRELYVASQFYVAMFWGTKTYNVRGKTKKGNARRKTYTLKVPVSMSVLDPTKVVPVGSLLFGQERLAWISNKAEMGVFNDGSDQTLKALFEKQYTPTEGERSTFEKMGIDCQHLLLFKKDAVWRHCLTRPAYKRWADVRMKSVFALADLKANLRQMERAHLVGATNFILVVKKGTDKLPARQQELNNLDKSVRKLARVPVLVGDHRLSVEIVTPKMDTTLDEKRWHTLDSRIGSRLLMTLAAAGDSARQDNSLTIGRAIARGLESRRHSLSRAIERFIVAPVCEKNKDILETQPSHSFAPKHIALDWDANFVQLLMKLRDRGDLSRETILEEADFSQEIEFRRREYEAEVYDDTFQTAVPFDSPQNNSQPTKSTGGADNKTGSNPPGRPKGTKTGSNPDAKK